MTGPEHYREAERLVRKAESARVSPREAGWREHNLAAAQVHATLALAAATVATTKWANGQAVLTPEELEAWAVAVTR